MALGTIASKIYGAALEERSLILEPMVAYQRLTTLAPNWIRCRIALVASLINADSISDPVSDYIGASGIDAFRPIVGLSNGQGLPSYAGVRFVGMSLGPVDHQNWSIVSSGGSVYISSLGESHWGSPILWNNGVRSWNTGFPLYTNHKPMAISGDSFGLMCDINANTDGSLTVGGAGIPNCSASNANIELMRAMTQPVSDSLRVGGGWWSSAAPETGCRHLFIRIPCPKNRLRIHALRVMQLA